MNSSPLEHDGRGILRDTAARLSADIASLLCAIAASVVTARVLGPVGKGELAALTFLIGMVAQLAGLSLGDTAVILSAQRLATLRSALAASLGILVIALPVSVLLFVLLALTVLPSYGLGTIAVGAALIVVVTAGSVAVQFANAHSLFARTSAITIIAALVSVTLTWLFVAVLKLDVAGALLANLAAAAVTVVPVTLLLRHDLAAPRLDLPYLAKALRTGAQLQLTQFILHLAGRADILVVLWLAGAAAAGTYSVAVTVGGLAAMAPLALALTTFPRIAYGGQAMADDLTAQTCRLALAAAVLSSVPLLLASPFLVPLLFGGAFEAAVVPAAVLLGSYTLASGQWVIGRAIAARGRPGVLAKSYALGTATTLVIDLFVVPALGLLGASLAAAVGATIGFAYALAAVTHGEPSRASEYLPRPADFKRLLSLPLRLRSVR